MTAKLEEQNSRFLGSVRRVLKLTKEKRREYLRHFISEYNPLFLGGPVGLAFFAYTLSVALLIAFRSSSWTSLLWQIPTLLVFLTLRLGTVRDITWIQRRAYLWFDSVIIFSYIEVLISFRIYAPLQGLEGETGRLLFVESLCFQGFLCTVLSLYPRMTWKILRDLGFFVLQIISYTLLFGIPEPLVVFELGLWQSLATLLALVLLLSHKVRFVLIQKFNSQKTRVYREFSKILYRHQVTMIEDGKTLQDTMPQGASQACVISFDIQGSSRLGHDVAHKFFSTVMKKCNKIMLTGYDGKSLVASAYRIKEMGDGFLCSVGFPFQSPQSNFYNEAVSLAKNFLAIFSDEAAQAFPSQKVYCGIGISYGEINGMYPSFGALEYECYGHAIVLATRYEKMRKILQKDGVPAGSIIILQAQVYEGLSQKLKDRFRHWDIPEGMRLAEDPQALQLYYLVIP